MTAKDLKNALLQEAVQGKLVPQIASEGNASDLLQEIRKERLSHGFANSYGICDGKDKKTKSSDLRSKSQIRVTKKELPEITEDEIPFEIPESWCWCRWGDLSESIQYGYNAPAKETGRIKMVRISDIHENKVFWDSVPYCDISEDEIQTYILKKNDILFARTGGTVGKSFLVQDVPCEAIYAGYLIRTHYNSEKLVPQYLKFFMESNLYWEQLKEGTIATAQPNCNGKTLSKMLFPLPPLTEQKRIVAAIEKFMPLIEEYGRKETELKAFNEQIGALTKKAILQEAVQGKLVPQIAAEGNAKDLLEEIRKERLSHGFANSYGICDGKNKKTKSSDLHSKSPQRNAPASVVRVTKKELPEITEDEIPFEIPESWCWCKVEDITIPIGNKSNQIQSKEVLKDGKIPVVSQGQNLIDGYSNEIEKTVTDIPVIMFGDHTRNVKFIDFPFVIGADGTKFFKPILCNVHYIYYLITLISLKLRNRGYARHYSLLKEEWLPLPPLAEQKRIVDAIEKLLPLCEKL